MTQDPLFLWLIIIAAGLVTYIIRINPIFLVRRFLSPESSLTRFLEYASFGVLGGLISISIQKAHQTNEIGSWGIHVGLVPAAATIVVVILATLKTRNMFVCLSTGMGIYTILYLLGL